MPADSVLLLDVESGEVLYGRNIDQPIPPASLTKLVTIALAMEYMNQEGIKSSDTVQISSRAWARNAPPRSSLMFLGPDQDPTWGDLLLGLAVDSGNDAAIALAEAVSGNVDRFVVKMNELVTRMGLTKTTFVEPSGYSELNMTTARDYCTFMLWYVRTFPENLKNLHSVTRFTYPYKEGTKSIQQANHNRLIRDYPGADGLKTGYIDESGYNLAFTASRDGFRLLGIILGGKSEAARNKEAEYLLDQGFAQWEARWLEIPPRKDIRAYHAQQGLAETQKNTVRVLLPRIEWDKIYTESTVSQAIKAPWRKSIPVGEVRISTHKGSTVARLPIHLSTDLAEANPVQNAAEEAYLWFTGQTGPAAPVDETKGRELFLPVKKILSNP